MELVNVWQASVSVPGHGPMTFRGSNEQSARVRAATYARNLGYPDAPITVEPPV